MANTSVSLGPHWEAFIAGLVAGGRYGSASEVVRTGLRLLEEEERKLDRLRELIREGEESGFSEPWDYEAFKAEMRAEMKARSRGRDVA